MKTRKHPDEQAIRLAHRQAGVISHAQLQLIGLPSEAGKRWKRGWNGVGPGLYCLTDPTWHSWCWVGVLHAGETGVIGGLAAAHLHKLSPQPPESITVWHERSSRLGRLGDTDTAVVFKRAARAGRGELPRTGVEDTLLDAAREADEDEVISLTTRALAQKTTTPGRLLTAIDARQKMSHRQILTKLCGVAGEGVESVLEWRFLELVVRAHGLPEPDRQVRLLRGTRSDCVWDQFGVVVELDGEAWHKDPFRDMSRDNRLALTGRLPLHYGWYDVNFRPCETAWQLHQALQSRGYDGPRLRCRRCRLVSMS